jgi:isopenicillin N synthase-like dioxygenase
MEWAAFYGSDDSKKAALVEKIREACERFGFFQLINHEVPSTLQQQVIKQSKELFELPLEIKEKYGKGKVLNYPFSKPIFKF